MPVVSEHASVQNGGAAGCQHEQYIALLVQAATGLVLTCSRQAATFGWLPYVQLVSVYKAGQAT